jgi:transposase
MLRTGEMSDDLWKPMEPLLPEGPHQGRPGTATGRHSMGHRRIAWYATTTG